MKFKLFLIILSVAIQFSFQTPSYAKDLKTTLEETLIETKKKLEAYDTAFLESIIPPEHLEKFQQTPLKDKKIAMEVMAKGTPNPRDLNFVHLEQVGDEARYYYYQVRETEFLSMGALKFNYSQGKKTWISTGSIGHHSKIEAKLSPKNFAMKVFREERKFHFGSFPPKK